MSSAACVLVPCGCTCWQQMKGAEETEVEERRILSRGMSQGRRTNRWTRRKQSRRRERRGAKVRCAGRERAAREKQQARISSQHFLLRPHSPPSTLRQCGYHTWCYVCVSHGVVVLDALLCCTGTNRGHKGEATTLAELKREQLQHSGLEETARTHGRTSATTQPSPLIISRRCSQQPLLQSLKRIRRSGAVLPLPSYARALPRLPAVAGC